MTTGSSVLSGGHVRLEPLDHSHIDTLVSAAGAEAQLLSARVTRR